VTDQAPFPSLQRYLREKYAGQSLTFVALLNDDYPVGHSWIEPDYKKALKAMEAQGQGFEIRRDEPLTPGGKQTTAIKYADRLVFSGSMPPSAFRAKQ